MSLKDEREYELFPTKLTYDVEGTSVGEHPISYPLLLPREDLVDNKPCV